MFSNFMVFLISECKLNSGSVTVDCQSGQVDIAVSLITVTLTKAFVQLTTDQLRYFQNLWYYGKLCVNSTGDL